MTSCHKKKVLIIVWQRFYLEFICYFHIVRNNINKVFIYNNINEQKLIHVNIGVHRLP